MKNLVIVVVLFCFCACVCTKAEKDNKMQKVTKATNEAQKDTTIHLQLLLENNIVQSQDSTIYNSVVNKTPNLYATGTDFCIERQENGKWIPLKYKANSWEAISYGIKAQDSLIFHFHLKSFWHKFHTGTYRIIKPIELERKKRNLTIEFKFLSQEDKKNKRK